MSEILLRARARDDLKPIWRYSFQKRIEIVRVLHQSMDVESHL